MSLKFGDENRKVVYKYRSLADKKSFDRVEDIIARGMIYFAQPSSFAQNDPLDTAPSIEFRKDTTIKDVQETLLRIKPTAMNTPISKGNAQIESVIAHLEQLHKEASPQEISDMFFKISCFTTEYDNERMWEVYGDKHRGICIGFKVLIYGNSLCIPSNLLGTYNKEHNGYLPLIHVEYCNQALEPWHYFKDHTNLTKLQKFLTTKRTQYAYESEYRSLISAADPSQVELASLEIIAEVIFGKDVADSDFIKVMDSIGNPKVMLYRMRQTNCGRLERVIISQIPQKERDRS